MLDHEKIKSFEFSSVLIEYEKYVRKVDFSSLPSSSVKREGESRGDRWKKR